MGDVVVRHCQNGNLRDAAGVAFHDAGTFVQAGKVRVQVAGVAFAAGDLAFRGRELTQCLGVAGHIGHHDQHVHALLERQIFGGRQRAARGQDAFDNRVGREV